MENNQNASQSPQPRRISWRTIVLAILTIITFFAVYRPGPYYYDVLPMGVGEGGIMESSGGTKSMPSTSVGAPAMDRVSDMYYPYPYPDPNVSAKDTREFLKIYYNALMQTRDVQGLTRRVETTVRGHGGRVDAQSSSEKYGSVSFVVPQSKYNAFRDELESLVGSKFIEINISSQNLLSQKLILEEQEKQDETFLANIATVNGTVSVRWISLWGIARLYLPGYSIPGIFALLTAISFFFDRRRFRKI